MLLLIRDGFLNHCLMTPVVICQPLSKFNMVTSVVSHTMCPILFISVNGGNQSFGFLVGEHKREGNFERIGDKVG